MGVDLMPKVVLDPGHGGAARANRGPTGYIEADGVLDISLKVREILKGFPSIQVFMTREADITLDSGPRINKVNGFNGDICVSIHTNAGPPEANGVDVFKSVNAKAGTGSDKLGRLVSIYVANYAGIRNRGVKARAIDGKPTVDYYFMIREIKCVSIIVECAFHTNPKEEALLKTDEFRYKCALGIARGIVEYFGISWVEPKSEPNQILYRVFLNGIQQGAFAIKDNAFKKAQGIILKKGEVVTITENNKEIFRREYEEPKIDYKEEYEKLKVEYDKISIENSKLREILNKIKELIV